MAKKTRDFRISSTEVAKRAGVSQATVSRVFTPGIAVSEKIRQKVLKAAQELGYHPNMIARSLNQRSTKIIGIVMAKVAHPFYSVVLREFSRKLQELGYWTLLLNIEYGHNLEDVLLTALQYQVDGIVITSATLSSQMAESCIRAGTPAILFNRYEVGSRVNTVCVDNVGSGRLVADTFINAGYTRFAYIAGEEGSSTNRDRERGFTERLQEREYVLQFREAGGDFTYNAGYAATKRLLQTDNPPEAIFCASDLIAMGALDVAQMEFHLKIPEGLSIVGFDDIEMASWPRYSLTTVKQPIERMIDVTINMLIDAINSPGGETVIKLIPGELVKRNSFRGI